MQLYQSVQNDFVISTDKLKLDVGFIHHYLSTESYWAKNIPLEKVQRAVDHSFCFGVYKNESDRDGSMQQIGFARVITDCATFGYLADVFITEAYRGIGLSKWLLKEILACDELQGFRSWMLATKDAHALYEKFGFKTVEGPGRLMRLGLLAEYPEQNNT